MRDGITDDMGLIAVEYKRDRPTTVSSFRTAKSTPSPWFRNPHLPRRRITANRLYPTWVRGRSMARPIAASISDNRYNRSPKEAACLIR